MPVRISVAGAVEMEADGAPVDLRSLGRVGRHFWVYLVCERHRPVAKDQLAEILWGDDLPRSWEQMLRGNASKLRAILAATGLEQAVTLNLALGAYQVVLATEAVVDVEEAAVALERALAALDAGDAEEAHRAASASVAVAARGFLAGWPGTWVEHRQAELRELHLRGLELLARAATASGRWPDAVAAAEEAVAIEPFRESAHQLVMAAHRGAGNPAEALRAYERCRRVLAEELGVSPTATTERLYLALLDDDAAAAEGDNVVPLPAPLGPWSGSFLVGRADASARLHAALDRLARGGRQAVLIAGEPGIGKTALVADFARAAHAGGAQVLYGRCDEDLGVAYQPFAEALSNYVAHCPIAQLDAHVAAHGAHVSRIAPELLRRLPDALPLETTASEADRYRLFEAVADLVDRACRRRSVVLVVDDLHWAPPPTLALLLHLVRSRPPALLVVGTYRHTEVGPGHPLAAALADLWREPGVERLALPGLDEDGVAAFVEQREGHPLDAAGQALVRALHTRTAGNPFFVGEFLRHLAETGGVYRKEGTWVYYEDSERRGVPEGVRDVIARRLGRLPATANHVLTLASVVGIEFDLQLLERVAGSTTLDGLDGAVTARVVTEVGTGRYQFAHALVRDTIYAALTATRRARLHHQVGAALAALAGDPEPRMPALAHHFAEAAADGTAIEAGQYALAAARQAFDRSAWEDVLQFVRTALAVLSTDDPAQLDLRVELLLVEHETLLVMVDIPPSIDVLRAAVDTVRLGGTPATVARTLTLHLLTNGAFDAAAYDQAKALAEHLGDTEPHIRARLLSGLAAADDFRHPHLSEAKTLAALGLARESGDAEALYAALLARKLVLADSPYALERLAVEEELAANGPVPRAVAGTRWMHSLGQGRAVARLVLGDRTSFEAEVDRLDRLLQEMRNRGGGWNIVLWRGALALLDGRFADAEKLAVAAIEMGPSQRSAWTIQVAKLALERGREAEVEDDVVSAHGSLPANGMIAGMLGCIHAATGRTDDALRIVAGQCGRGFGHDGPRPTPTAMAYLAEVVSSLGEREWAAKIYDVFAPYSGLVPFTGFGAHCPGAADRYLGQLAATLQRWEDAEKHYDEALRIETGLRAPPLLARTRYWYGRMLLERDRPGDADRARALLQSAVEGAEILGMPRLAAQASALA